MLIDEEHSSTVGTYFYLFGFNQSSAGQIGVNNSKYYQINQVCNGRWVNIWNGGTSFINSDNVVCSFITKFYPEDGKMYLQLSSNKTPAGIRYNISGTYYDIIIIWNLITISQQLT